MIKKLLTGFLISFLLYSRVVFSQATDNWYFGSAAGFPNTGIHIDFSSGTPVVLNNSPIATQEGSSSISDANGQSLFYTDGNTVWLANHSIMPGGNNTLKGGSSATQSATIVPMPTVSNKWYIFTGGQDPGTGPDGGMNYNIVTSLSGGTWTVQPSVPLRAPGTVGEAICIVGSSKPGATYWVISHERSSRNILAFEVNSTTGVVASPVVSSIAGTTTLPGYIGTVKANACQTQLAFTEYGNITYPGKVELYNFNSATGAVTSLVASIPAPNAYGIEFSSNDQYLYFTQLDEGQLHQYNIAGSSDYAPVSWDRGGSGLTGELGQLQLGPDGKIYCALPGPLATAQYIGVINNPNSATAAANFVLNGLYIAPNQNSGFSYRGLPTFPKSLVISGVSINPASNTFCTGNPQTVSYTFAGASTSQTWTINPGSGWTYTTGTSTSSSPIITFNTPGTYTITSTVFDVCSRTYTDRAVYTITDPLVPGGTLCTAAGVVITLAATGANPALYPRYVWFPTATSTSPLGIGGSVSLNYSDPTRVPSTFWVEVSSTATSISSGSNIIPASPLNWDANGAVYAPIPFTVLGSNFTLRSFSVAGWTGGGSGNFNVTIRNSSSAIVFQKGYFMPASILGSNMLVNINTDFQTGIYSITLSSSGIAWRGGPYTTIANAGQVILGQGGSGTYPIGGFRYDYANYTYTPTCATRVAINSCIPLPINLLNFGAELKGSKVELLWSTSSETNNDRFEIQRSLDGIHFSTIKSIKGAGNSSRITEYTTTDNSPAPKTNYYRLVQYDVDGKESISEVISVNVISEELDFTISPNPSTNTFNLYLKNINSGEISITDLLGKLVLTKTLSSEVNSFEFGEDLVKGAYVVKVSSNNGSATKLIIKE